MKNCSIDKLVIIHNMLLLVKNDTENFCCHWNDPENSFKGC